jgi:acetyltransferase
MVEALGPEVSAQQRTQLQDLLIACVAGGASIGFLAPLSREDAAAYWRKIEAELPAGQRVLMVVRTEGGESVGSAQMLGEVKANGRHRAEVQKVMVHPTHRRRGLAAALMAEVERVARARGVTLLFLDTSDSHAGARGLYEALGYVYEGGIPGYALDPHGKPEQNAIFYKTLAPGG